MPEAQDEKLDLIESLAWSIGPLLQSGEAAPLSASERVQALEGLRTTLAEALAGDLTAERNPGAAALAEALSGFASANADEAARAELEARLLGLLPALLDDLRQALEAGPVGQDDLPDEVRDRWLTPDGQARVLVQPAGQIDDNARASGVRRGGARRGAARDRHADPGARGRRAPWSTPSYRRRCWRWC